ncbi:HD domain-containing protein [Thermodesulfitimonas autotrophica]|uniref:HD domain-containing protein n=1 Tax=Thermodesulfitimonas autotrophica TaxID=1894989 RepID=A0A3N5AT56_9THEO|nr:HD-GYP domain-containing protein [Thermodesulfitimonas autotrophica]RPF46820.1 HD domain-containing protein [Thermodesulfitimonas autotrophica]
MAALYFFTPLFVSRLKPYSFGRLLLLSPYWYGAFTVVLFASVVLLDSMAANPEYHYVVHFLYYLPVSAAALGHPLFGLAVGLFAALVETAGHYHLSPAGVIHFAVGAVTYGGLVGLLHFLQARIEFSAVIFNGFVSAFSRLLHERDAYTAHHSVTAAQLALRTTEELRLTPQQQAEAYLAGLLHDMGKVAIPDAILFKPQRLSREEWTLVKQHPVVGATLLAQIPGLEGVATAIRHHHERWDGTGYPDGLKGEAIPITARIVCVTDAFEAMLSHRPYRRGLSLPEAVAELERCAGSQFDPQVVTAVTRVVQAPDIASQLKLIEQQNR